MNKKISKIMLTSASALALFAAYPSVAQNANEALGLDLETITAEAATAAGRNFVNRVMDLPNVSEIAAMTPEGIQEQSRQMDRARRAYDRLSAADKDATVERWEGFLYQKERAIGNVFIDIVMNLHNVAEIEEFNTEDFAAEQQRARRARNQYDDLADVAKANLNVVRWLEFLELKEQPLGITFVDLVQLVPNVETLDNLTDQDLAAAVKAYETAKASYDKLPDAAKRDALVVRWAGFLADKADAIRDEIENGETPTDPELTLEEAKIEAILELERYGDLSEYAGGQQTTINSIIESQTKAINNASTVERVNTLLENAKVAIDDVPTADELNSKELNEKLKEARAFLAGTDVNDYEEEDRVAYYEIIANTERALATARTVDRIESILADAEQALDDLKDAGTTDAAALAAAIRSAEAEVNAYQSRIGTDITFTNHFEDAKSVARVNTLLADAISQIDESLFNTKQSAKRNLVAPVDLSNYTVNRAAVEEAIATGQANIDAATTVSAVIQARDAAKEVIAKIETDNDLTYTARVAAEKLPALARDGELTQADIDAAQVAVDAMPQDSEHIAGYQQLIANAQAALNAKNTILALPAEEDVTFADEADIVAARAEFEALPYADHVPENVRQRLHRAEVAITVLRGDAVGKFQKEVNELPLVEDIATMGQAELTKTAAAVESARATYNALPSTLLDHGVVVEREGVLTAVTDAVEKRQTQLIVNRATTAVVEAERAVDAINLDSAPSAKQAAQEAIEAARILVNQIPASSNDFTNLDIRLTKAQAALNVFNN